MRKENGSFFFTIREKQAILFLDGISNRKLYQYIYVQIKIRNHPLFPGKHVKRHWKNAFIPGNGGVKVETNSYNISKDERKSSKNFYADRI